jgi:hypothetical protein
MMLTGHNRRTSALYPPQNPHGLATDRNRFMKHLENNTATFLPRKDVKNKTI